jgi:hypothetical protein
LFNSNRDEMIVAMEEKQSRRISVTVEVACGSDDVGE